MIVRVQINFALLFLFELFFVLIPSESKESGVDILPTVIRLGIENGVRPYCKSSSDNLIVNRFTPSETDPPIQSSKANSSLINHDIPAYPKSFQAKQGEQRVFPLTPIDLQHGEHQLEMMIHDRPKMAKYVNQGDQIWNWTARQFAGECTGKKYFWSGNESKIAGTPGWHNFPEPGKLGTITVGQTYNMPAEGDYLWAIAVFELLNTRNDDAFLAWYNHFEFGKISKEEFVKQTAWREYMTARQTYRFYIEFWKPHCEKMHLHCNGNYWFEGISPNFNQWFNSLPKNSPYLKQYRGDN